MGLLYLVEIGLISGKGIKNVNCRNGNLKPYAIISVDPSSIKSVSNVDDDGHVNPHWNQRFLTSTPIALEESVLSIDILHKGDETDPENHVGSACLPLAEFVGRAGESAFRGLPLLSKSGQPCGTLAVKIDFHPQQQSANQPCSGMLQLRCDYGPPPPVPDKQARYAGGHVVEEREIGIMMRPAIDKAAEISRTVEELEVVMTLAKELDRLMDEDDEFPDQVASGEDDEFIEEVAWGEDDAIRGTDQRGDDAEAGPSCPVHDRYSPESRRQLRQDRRWSI